MKITVISIEELVCIVAGLVREGVNFSVNKNEKKEWIITLTGGF